MDIELCALARDPHRGEGAAAGRAPASIASTTTSRRASATTRQIVSTHTWRDRVETPGASFSRRLAGMVHAAVASSGSARAKRTCSICVCAARARRRLGPGELPRRTTAAPRSPAIRSSRPGLALRALCMFRFAHPRTDLRVAGGREPHAARAPVRSCAVSGELDLHAGLSDDRRRDSPRPTTRMIKDAGWSWSWRRARRCRRIPPR